MRGGKRKAKGGKRKGEGGRRKSEKLNQTIKISGTPVACVTYDSAMEIVQRLAREPRPVISRAAVYWAAPYWGGESSDEKETDARQNPVRAGLINNEDDWPSVLDRSEIDMAGR